MIAHGQITPERTHPARLVRQGTPALWQTDFGGKKFARNMIKGQRTYFADNGRPAGAAVQRSPSDPQTLWQGRRAPTNTATATRRDGADTRRPARRPAGAAVQRSPSDPQT